MLVVVGVCEVDGFGSMMIMMRPWARVPGSGHGQGGKGGTGKMWLTGGLCGDRLTSRMASLLTAVIRGAGLPLHKTATDFAMVSRPRLRDVGNLCTTCRMQGTALAVVS